MKKYHILIFILLFALFACSTTTTIKKGEQELYTVKSKSDSLVVLKQTDPDDKVLTDLTVDNRGKPTLIEQLAVLIFGSIPKEVSVD